VAVGTFLCLIVAAFGSLLVSARCPPRQLREDTLATVRMVTNIFVVMASLALGLMLNSGKNTFEANQDNVHALATDLILLDRTMRAVGPEADEAHRHLVEYVQISLKDPDITEENPQAEASLDAVGASLRAIRLADDQRLALWNDARQLYRQAVQQRWIVVDAAEGKIPPIMILMLIGWLVIVFVGFGYLAPRNLVVTTWFVVAALVISGTLFVILNMETPSSSVVRISNSPFQRALTEIQP
jgi:hypothetical protein